MYKPVNLQAITESKEQKYYVRKDYKTTYTNKQVLFGFNIDVYIMAILVVEFSREGYKIRKVFA